MSTANAAPGASSVAAGQGAPLASYAAAALQLPQSLSPWLRPLLAACDAMKNPADEPAALAGHKAVPGDAKGLSSDAVQALLPEEMLKLTSARILLRKKQETQNATIVARDALEEVTATFTAVLDKRTAEQDAAEKAYHHAACELKALRKKVVSNYNTLLASLKRGDWVWVRSTDPVTKTIIWRRSQVVQIDAYASSGAAVVRAHNAPESPSNMLALSWAENYSEATLGDTTVLPSPSGDIRDQILVHIYAWEDLGCLFDC
jgi:hypothetical protein